MSMDVQILRLDPTLSPQAGLGSTQPQPEFDETSTARARSPTDRDVVCVRTATCSYAHVVGHCCAARPLAALLPVHTPGLLEADSIMQLAAAGQRGGGDWSEQHRGHANGASAAWGRLCARRIESHGVFVFSAPLLLPRSLGSL